MGLGDEIRARRLAAGLTQAALADLAGIDATYLSKLESGRQRASERVLRSLASAMEADPARLLLLAGRVPEELQPALTRPGDGTTGVPVYPTALVGREQEIEQLQRLLPASRMLSVLGPPGCGKTRLVAELAGRLAAGGAAIHWVAVREDEGADALAARVEVGAAGATVVLDDADLAPGSCAEVARRLVASGDDVRVAATSRRPLGIYGERLFRVAPLPAPGEHWRAPSSPLALHQLQRNQAIRLFVERASFADPAFQLAADNAEAVLELCKRLDGVPLALELAALRLRHLTVAELAARLDDLFDWLVGNTPDVPARHASMDAAIGWSFERLSPVEQTVAGRLSVFAAPFDLEAAADVAADEEVRPEQVLRALLHLVDRSFLQQAPLDGGALYRWVQPIREYCQRCLEGQADSEQTWKRFIDRCSRQLDSLQTGVQSSSAEWARLMDSVQDWVAAVSRLRAQRQREAPQLGPAWRVLAMDDLPDGWALIERLAAQSRGSSVGHAAVLRNAGVLARVRGDLQTARRHCSAAHRIYRTRKDRRGEADTHVDLALIDLAAGDLRSAEGRLGAAGPIYAQLGYEVGSIDVQNYLGRVRLATGDEAGARELFMAALRHAERLEEPRLIAFSAHDMGIVECLRGSIGAARSHLERSLAIKSAMRNRTGLAMLIETFALLESGQGKHSLAAQLLGAARRYRLSIDGGLGPWWERLVGGVEEAAGQALGQAAAQRCLDLGLGLTLEQAAELATRGAELAARVRVVLPPRELLRELTSSERSILIERPATQLVVADGSREAFDGLLARHRAEHEERDGPEAGRREAEAVWARLDELFAAGRLEFFPADQYERHEARARHWATREEEDWPSVAVALATGLPILADQPGLFDGSIPIWSLPRLGEELDQLAGSAGRRPIGRSVTIRKSRAEQALEDFVGHDAPTGDVDPHEVLFVGWQLHRHNDLSAARGAYERVVESGDRAAAPLALRNLGLLLERQGQFHDAISAYRRAIASGDQDVAPWAGVNLGWLLAQLGDLDASRGAYQAVIASGHASHAPKAEVNLALLLSRQGRTDETRELLERVSQSNHPRQAPRAMRHLAHLFEQQGDLDAARELLERTSRTGDARQAAKAEADLVHLRGRLGHAEETAYGWLPRTPLERAIVERDPADRSTAVSRQFADAELLALGAPAGQASVPGGPARSDLLCLSLDESGRRSVVIPVFTRTALLVPALLRDSSWRSCPVLTLRGAELLADLRDDEAVLIDPWTPLRFRITLATARPLPPPGGRAPRNASRAVWGRSVRGARQARGRDR